MPDQPIPIGFPSVTRRALTIPTINERFLEGLDIKGVRHSIRIPSRVKDPDRRIENWPKESERIEITHDLLTQIRTRNRGVADVKTESETCSKRNGEPCGDTRNEGKSNEPLLGSATSEDCSLGMSIPSLFIVVSFIELALITFRPF